MANTMTVSRVERGSKQFQGAFSDLWLVTGTVGDQDAIADDVSVRITLTVPGVALGDMVLGISFGAALIDANSNLTVTGFVSAANTVILVLVNVDDAADAYDADVLTGGGFRLLVGRPSW